MWHGLLVGRVFVARVFLGVEASLLASKQCHAVLNALPDIGYSSGKAMRMSNGSYLMNFNA